jgi:hypothetical protein
MQPESPPTKVAESIELFGFRQAIPVKVTCGNKSLMIIISHGIQTLDGFYNVFDSPLRLSHIYAGSEEPVKIPQRHCRCSRPDSGS